MSKLLVAGGLVLVTGPLSFQLQAQDYVDVEAERSGRTTPAAPATATPDSADPYARPAGTAPYTAPSATDPYSVQPAQSYPATSYGMDSAPAGSAVGTPAPGAAAAAPGGGGQMGTLFIQLQQLQQEVMRLNGIVEEQANELRKLKSQSLERYVDLDKRLSALGSGSGATASNPGAATAPSVPIASPGAGAAEVPGEGDAYRSAYALVRNQQFDQAVDAFSQFLRSYPDGRYAPNAHYWLGELYLVIDPPDLEASRQSFSLLLDRYPDNAKAPDAMYKLGKVQFLKGNREKSREYLDRVIREYGNTNSSAVKLSRDFLAENF
ncbi:tol-pal system protein YbgF [Seongchinamella sediminis]|nr:tol-pal system protein YbgF [Seongchinamella sediminis]